MNNLKRVLSLALSGIMLVGMMAMGASAADFTDADEIQHDEAVNVLVALNIINGQDDGSFNPTGDVTRAQMAKMIAVAMNGGTDTNTGVKGTATFTDIKGHWAESYIEYCADLGIISGRGDGTFDPEGNVTGLEATKMVLTALGYDAEAYQLTGAKWSVRTDELARQASPTLYEDLTGTVMATKASRDTAAQLIWNGLQNYTRRVSPTTNKNNGEVTWSYIGTNGPEGGTDRLLKERYDANITTGTFNGNYNTGNAQNKGEVNVAGRVFPYELPIEEIGEEMKVIWKDGKDSKNGSLDRKDVIFGVFNTGKTQVHHVTMADMQGAGTSNLNNGKIKFGDTLYDVVSDGVDVVYNYDSTSAKNANGQTASQIETALKQQSVDTIKFIVRDSVDANNGKIEKAYVTNYNIARVSSVSSSKITLQGVGTIDQGDNDIYDGAAVDDVVVYTRFYDDMDKDEAFFTVTEAETVEGQLTGFKFDSSKYQNVVVDGTTIKVNYPATKLPANLTNDYVSDLSDSVLTSSRSGEAGIGDTVRIYKIGNLVGCVQLVEGEAGKYAVVTEVNDGAVDSVMNPLKVSVLFADGSKEVLTVHKDSTFDNSTKIKGQADEPGVFDLAKSSGGTTEKGNLIEYSTVAGGSIKIKAVASKMSTSQSSTLATTNTLVWDEDAKVMHYKNGNYAVAAADAVMFVGVDNANGSADGKINNWYSYDMRGMGDVKNEYVASGAISGGSNTGTTVQYFLNDKGLVAAGCVFRNAKPGSNSADTLYGIVTGYTGTRQNADGDDLWKYTVAVGRDEDIDVAVKSQTNALSAGQLVMFKERADGEYDLGDDIVVILGSNDGTGTPATDETLADSSNCAGVESNTSFILGAVREYNADKGVITYYTKTTFDGTMFKGPASTDTGSRTVAKDVALYYVNADGKKQGDDVGVTMYDASTGYANVIMHTNDKGIVDAIIVETSGKANLADANTDSTEVTTNFGSGALTLGSANKTDTGITVEVTPSQTVGASTTAVTYTIKVTGTAAADGASDTITVALANLTGTLAIAPASGSNCTASVTGTNVTITITANDTATSGTFTVSGATGLSGNVTPTITYTAV